MFAYFTQRRQLRTSTTAVFLQIEATFPDHVDMDAQFDCCGVYTGGKISEDKSREICLGFLEFMVATSGASEVRLMDTRVFVPPAILVKILETPALRRLVLQLPMSDYQKQGLQESRQANEFTSVVRAEGDDLVVSLTATHFASPKP
jgi:hypothetical protein